jgi:hypothetical protein
MVPSKSLLINLINLIATWKTASRQGIAALFVKEVPAGDIMRA